MSPTTPKTAIVLVDVYNEFLHPSGKIYPAIAESIQTTDSVTHIQTLISTARAAHLPIYYALHQTYKPGNYDGWQHMNATTNSIKAGKVIEDGSWGAELYEGMEPDVLGNGDVVVSKHWNSRYVCDWPLPSSPPFFFLFLLLVWLCVGLGRGDMCANVALNSGFANTDLDYQLHQREITHLVLGGMVANTCLESTARYARELGYHVTLL